MFVVLSHVKLKKGGRERGKVFVESYSDFQKNEGRGKKREVLVEKLANSEVGERRGEWRKGVI